MFNTTNNSILNFQIFKIKIRNGKKKKYVSLQISKHNRFYHAKLGKEETRILCESIYFIWGKFQNYSLYISHHRGQKQHNSINLKYRLRSFKIHETSHSNSSGKGKKYSISNVSTPLGKMPS